MNITVPNYADPPVLLWYKIAAQFYNDAVALGMSGEPQPFPTDTGLVLMRKTVNYTDYMADN